MTLGGRITLSRESINLTDAQLSRRFGVMLKTVRNWETDRSEPRGNKLATLAGVLGVSLQWLVTGDDNVTRVDENVEETRSLKVKLDRLINLHEQTSALIFEIQSDLLRLQNRIDRTEFES